MSAEITTVRFYSGQLTNFKDFLEVIVIDLAMFSWRNIWVERRTNVRTSR